MKLLAFLLATLYLTGVGPGYVYGTVTDAQTGAVITTEITTVPGLITTNGNGMYKTKFVSDGAYTFATTAPGYQANTVKLLVRAGTLTQYNIKLTKVTP